MRIQIPDFGGMIGRASRKMFNVGRKKDTGEIILVGLERTDWNNPSEFGILNHPPDINVALKRLAMG